MYMSVSACVLRRVELYSFTTLLELIPRNLSLRREQARAANLLDLLLGELTNVSALHHNRLGRKLTLTEELEDAVLGQVNHGRLGRVLGARFALLLANQSPELVAVNRRAVVVVLQLVEVTHTNLTEVTRVILIHHNAVVVLTTSHTATRRVFSVLADTTVTGGHVTALLTILV